MRGDLDKALADELVDSCRRNLYVDAFVDDGSPLGRTAWGLHRAEALLVTRMGTSMVRIMSGRYHVLGEPEVTR